MGAAARRTIRSCASRATACTRFRSGPVHAGIIEPGHFRFSDRRREGAAAGGAPGLHAQGHREALRGAAARSRAIASPAASRATAPSPTPGPTRRPLEAIAGVGVPPRAAWLRALCARARAHRQSPGRPRLSRQRRRVRVRPRAVLAAEGGRAAHERARVRPSLADGRRRAGRRGARSRRRRGRGDARRMRRARARGARAARHLRRARRAAGPLPRLRHRRRRNWPRSSASPASPGAPAARRAICAAISRRALRRARRAQGGARTDGDVAARVAVRFDEALRIAAPRARDRSTRCPEGDVRAALPRRPRVQARRWAASKAGAARCSSRSKAGPTARSAAAIRTIRRGRTGRCSSTR